ncbi:hypothetical protein ACUXST_000682 [Sphingomonas sp. F9_3S_D5_B_2]
MRRALLLSALLLASCSGKPENDSDLKAAFDGSSLKDPSSVQLRNVKANDHVICGEYNSKNSYGAYGGYEPFVFNRLIKDLWIGDSDNRYSRSAFWKDCPNAAQLGLAAYDTDMNAYDMNATDMNASAVADATLNAASNAVENAAGVVANAQGAIDDSGDVEAEPTADEPSYDVNNDGGE